MGELEGYYGRQEQQRQAQIPPFHEFHNRLVDLYQEIIDLMLAHVRVHPSERYEWVVVDGKRFVGWELHRDWDCHEYEYLLSDGRLVQTKANRADARVVLVRKVDSSVTSKHQLTRMGMLWFDTFQEMCQSIVSTLANYGSPNHPKWNEWYNLSRAYINSYR